MIRYDAGNKQKTWLLIRKRSVSVIFLRSAGDEESLFTSDLPQKIVLERGEG